MLDLKTNNESILSNLNECLKKTTPTKILRKHNLRNVAFSSINSGYLEGKKIKRIIFYLRSKGCEWSTTRNGGCFMCGHYHGTTKGLSLPEGAFYTQFVKEFAKYDFRDFPMICIYNAGSILNKSEVPRTELYNIFKIINSNKYIKCLIIESRPEFIDEEILESIQVLLKDTIVEIGIGLETCNDKIRNICINKGFLLQEYIDVANKIKKYKNIKLLTYLTVQPLFLTIKESINDVVESLKIVEQYTDVVSLEPISIQNGTLVEFLYKCKMYNPPKGWTIREILSKVSPFSYELRIGGFEFFPIPKKFISNCEKCNKDLYEAIDYYNTEKKADKILNLNCTCYDLFKTALYQESEQIESLEQRVLQVISELLLSKEA